MRHRDHCQENHFFDNSSCEPSSRQATLRLRFSDTDSLYVVTLKAKAIIVDGVSRVEEDEELLDPSIRRDCMAKPKKILSSAVESRVLRRVKEEFGVLGFVGLGGFGNMRFDAVYEWKGLKLEVDESDFEFRTLYEIECESSDLEKVKKLIEEIGIFLGKLKREKGIQENVGVFTLMAFWYKTRSSVKGQVLVDFVPKFSSRRGKEMVCPIEIIPWKVFADGASSTLGAGVGIVVITLEGIKLEHSFRLGFKVSNNEAEYVALLVELRVVSDLGVKEVKVYLDSRLVVNQVQGSFEVKDPQMMEYLLLVKQTMDCFPSVKVVQVARGQNRHINSLATLASSSIDGIPRLIKVELVAELSISAGLGVSLVATIEPCWMDSIINFLTEDRVPADEKEAKKCLHPSKIEELLAELYDGLCGSHVGGYSLAHRAMTQGFWCPRMQKDANEYARKCEQCQRHAPMIHQPVGNLNPISSPWPFAQWGLDIVGPFSQAIGNQRFVLVAVNYFTKWAEVEALVNIRDVDVKNLGITNWYSTLAYPQSNSQAEATNKAVVNRLKRRLEGAKGRWAEELSNVLWAYLTTPRRSTGDTPFSLTYGAEAVISTGVNLCSAQVSGFSLVKNSELMLKQLNLLEESWELATIWLAEYQQKLARRYNKNVRKREFGVGDSIL
ncbi:uncharacterized protein LOC115953191 [Quercus lobata]|uniref:uncharacterized protein LOC115953191 n=1 Tax=Quercus lobata TaxID=97700 RepID=UPI001247D6E9|nr:uncharacterized protein LOC115953191 [Quercus lobata]